MTILGGYSPNVRQVSFGGVSGLQRMWNPPLDLAASIPKATVAERSLRVSIDSAISCYFAKIALTQCKRNRASDVAARLSSTTSYPRCSSLICGGG